MQTSSTRYLKTGAIMFVLWGVLHIIIGAGSVMQYLSGGAAGIFSSFGDATASTQPLTPTLLRAAHVEFDFSMLLVGYGVLAIWMALLIWQRNIFAFWITFITLGIAEAAYVIALMIPGDIPIASGIGGPLLFVLGVVFTAMGFAGRKNIPDSGSIDT